MVSMRIFSTTWGIGLIGAASIIMVKTISTKYGMLTWFDDSVPGTISNLDGLDDDFYKDCFIDETPAQVNLTNRISVDYGK